MRKLLLILLVIFIVVGAGFASGQFEGPQDGTRPMTQQQLQECFVDGEFSMELFLENSPIVAKLDVDGDGIVDGTDVSVEDFILTRTDSFPIQRMQGGRMSNRSRGQGRRN